MHLRAAAASDAASAAQVLTFKAFVLLIGGWPIGQRHLQLPAEQLPHTLQLPGIPRALSEHSHFLLPAQS